MECSMLSWIQTNCHTCLPHFHGTAPLCLSAPFPCLVSMATLIRSEEASQLPNHPGLAFESRNILALPLVRETATCSANVLQWVHWLRRLLLCCLLFQPHLQISARFPGEWLANHTVLCDKAWVDSKKVIYIRTKSSINTLSIIFHPKNHNMLFQWFLKSYTVELSNCSCIILLYPTTKSTISTNKTFKK